MCSDAAGVVFLGLQKARWQAAENVWISRSLPFSRSFSEGIKLQVARTSAKKVLFDVCGLTNEPGNRE